MNTNKQKQLTIDNHEHEYIINSIGFEECSFLNCGLLRSTIESTNPSISTGMTKNTKTGEAIQRFRKYWNGYSPKFFKSKEQANYLQDGFETVLKRELSQANAEFIAEVEGMKYGEPVKLSNYRAYNDALCDVIALLKGKGNHE